MKRKRLLTALAKLLDMEGRNQRKHRDELKALLKKLKAKKSELKKKMLLETNERKRKRLDKELEIIKAQREKGLKALQDLIEK